MAHTYEVDSVSTIGDQNIVVGFVDGVAVTVSYWTTPASRSAMASAISFRNFIAPLMLAALPPTPTTSPALVQTFTQ